MTTSTNRPSGERPIVVVGGGFAGLGAAYALRHFVGTDLEVKLIAPDAYFVFKPSLIWTPLERPLEPIVLDLGEILGEKGITFVQAAVQKVRAGENTLVADDGEMVYEKLVIATGGRPDTSAVPGLAGEFRLAQWVVGEDSAMELRNVLAALAESPGPVIVGVASGAGYMSAAYELALLLDTHLRREGLRDQAPMTFVTAEPYLGDLGIGQTALNQALEPIFRERDIAARTNATIARVKAHGIVLQSGETLSSAVSIIMPPFTGAVDIWKSAGLTDEHGLIQVNDRYQHLLYADIYAAGIASRFAEPVPPLDGRTAPQTGYLSLRMGVTAAENVTAALGYNTAPQRALPDLLDIRVLDGGEDGAVIASHGVTELHHVARRVSGEEAHRLKEAYQRHLMWRLRTGHVLTLGATPVEATVHAQK